MELRSGMDGAGSGEKRKYCLEVRAEAQSIDSIGILEDSAFTARRTPETCCLAIVHGRSSPPLSAEGFESSPASADSLAASGGLVAALLKVGQLLLRWSHLGHSTRRAFSAFVARVGPFSALGVTRLRS
jgi:hypothetical protein